MCYNGEVDTGVTLFVFSISTAFFTSVDIFLSASNLLYFGLKNKISMITASVEITLKIYRLESENIIIHC